MNVFNVHVNRNPVSGTVIAKAYRPGKFFNASFDKASEYNERMSLRLRPEGETAEARDLAVVQIAGLVARRIVCDMRPGPGGATGRAIWHYPLRQPGGCLSAARLHGPGGQPGTMVRAGETVLARFG